MTPPRPYRHRELAGASILEFPDDQSACLSAAHRIAEAIRSLVAEKGRAVLGLATGATPVPVYGRLVSFHKEGSLSFAGVTTYNLDEYYPMGPNDPNSYRRYMDRHLFGHVDLAPNRAHVLDGTVPEAAVGEHVAQFDRWIADDGGLDLQLLGVGRNGHIGFNEPSGLPVEQALALPTRLIELHPTTVVDATKDFGDESRVPRRALTMGVAPILAARSIVVLAFGAAKAEAVARSLRGPVTAEVPGSLLQSIPGKVTWIVDRAAAADLG